MVSRLVCWLIGHKPGKFLGPTLYVYCRRCEDVTNVAREIAHRRMKGQAS